MSNMLCQGEKYVAKAITENTLFYGDNLEILRDYLIDECVDLIYLDPPFNSSRNYNVLFKDEHGLDSEAQITAFEDTWHWTTATEHAYFYLINHGPDKVAGMIAALRDFVGTNQMMAYLVMMTSRLVELRRVLKPTGSVYLHCDPTASHYIKILMDAMRLSRIMLYAVGESKLANVASIPCKLLGGWVRLK